MKIKPTVAEAISEWSLILFLVAVALILSLTVAPHERIVDAPDAFTWETAQ